MTKVGICSPGSNKPDLVLDVEYRYKSKSALKTYYENMSGKTDEEALDEIIVGWKGKEVPEYSTEAMVDLMERYPAAAAEFFEAYRKELTGAKQKN